MKNLFVKYIFLALILAIAGDSSAQNLEEDIQKAQKAYTDLENYRGKVISSILTSTGEKQQKVTTVYKRGKEFRYDSESISVYINPNFLLTHDVNNKSIYCNKSKGKGEQDFLKQMPIEDLLNYNKSFEFVGIQNGIKQYRLYPKDVNIEIMEIFFNEATALLEKVTYHYNSELNIGYEHVNMEFEHHLNEAISKSDILYSNFVSVIENKVKLKPKYKDYDLILGPDLAPM